MKASKLFKIFFLSTVMTSNTLISCISDVQSHRVETSNLSIDEARETYERIMSYYLQTRSPAEILDAENLPGYFTPDWSRAFINNKQAGPNLIIPINSIYRTKVLFRLKYGYAEEKQIEHRLVFVKQSGGNIVMPYIQVIVPSPVYNSNLNTIHDITEPNARFSGIVSYYLLSGDPVSLTLYEQGKLLISLHCSNNLDTQTQKLNYILQKIPNPVFIRSPVETISRGDYPPGYHFECPECGCTNCVHCLAMNPCQCACNGSNCSHIIPPIQVPVCAYCLCLLPCAGCQSCNLWSCSCGCHVNGGENPDGDHDKNICPICREYPCVCDSGGGSGLDNSRKHLAQRLFRNTSMIDATWAEIGRMLEEIINNCLGQKLFNDLENYLNGKKR